MNIFCNCNEAAIPSGTLAANRQRHQKQLEGRPTMNNVPLPQHHLLKRWMSWARRAMEHRVVQAKHAQGAGPLPVRMLLLSDGLSSQSEAQFDPILRYRSELGQKLGLIIETAHLDVDHPPSARQLAPHGLVLFKLYYKTNPEAVLRLASHLRNTMSSRSALIYCDGNDEMTIQWADLCRYCDIYWKKHAFRDRSCYLDRYRGGTNLTDYALGEEAGEPQSQTPIAGIQLRKIVCGYSIGLDRKIATLAPLLRNSANLPAWQDRKYDVMLRADIPDNWMGKLRRPAAETLHSLQSQLKILLPQGRVPQKQYAQEMMSSKICVSPFGYGEICWRDFEAVTYGCLLIKPSMDHVESRPDIFQPFKTYVPVTWDFSDLREKLLHYAGQPEECAKMVLRARCVLAEALETQWFVGVFGELLQAVDTQRSESMISTQSHPA